VPVFTKTTTAGTNLTLVSGIHQFLAATIDNTAGAADVYVRLYLIGPTAIPQVGVTHPVATLSALAGNQGGIGFSGDGLNVPGHIYFWATGGPDDLDTTPAPAGAIIAITYQ